MEKAEKIVVVVAILLLSVGVASSYYVNQIEKENKELAEGNIILVGDTEINLDELFEKYEVKNVETTKGNFTGISLSALINETNIEDKDAHDYTVVGSDGYKQTVSWEDMKKGIITEEKKTVFPHLPGKFWVKDIVKIEVS